MTINISDVVVLSGNGQKKRLGEYSGQVLLVVNVASKCGFTKQYKELQTLQNTYKERGLRVLGFPCNDFGGQEPGTLPEIQEFCLTNYGANFELFEKVHAMGNTTEPYTTLNQTEPAGDVSWNFEKFLIGKDGQVIQRFKSATDPLSPEITEAIETALAN